MCHPGGRNSSSLAFPTLSPTMQRHMHRRQRPWTLIPGLSPRMRGSQLREWLPTDDRVNRGLYMTLVLFKLEVNSTALLPLATITAHSLSFFFSSHRLTPFPNFSCNLAHPMPRDGERQPQLPRPHHPPLHQHITPQHCLIPPLPLTSLTCPRSSALVHLPVALRLPRLRRTNNLHDCQPSRQIWPCCSCGAK